MTESRRQRDDPTLRQPVGEVREDDGSRAALINEKELIDQRKKAANSSETAINGLALSGGGIRSASFSFGVLQALEDRGLMKHVDYLSTVSGGGYTGAAYSGWRLRKTLHSMKRQSEAIPEGLPKDVQVIEPPPEAWHQLLPHLRNFSSYILPRAGIASDDTWRIVGTVVRNITVHWFAIVSAILFAFAALLLILRHPLALSFVFFGIGLTLIGFGLRQEVLARRYVFGKTGQDDDAGLLAVRRLLQEPRLQLFTGLGFYGLAASLWFVSTTQPDFLWATNVIGGQDAVALGLWQQLRVATWPGLLVAVIVVVLSAALVVGIGFASEWRWRPRRDFRPKIAWIGLFFAVALVFLTWLGLAIFNGQIVAPDSALEVASEAPRRSLATAWQDVWQSALVMTLFALVASVVIAILNDLMDREEREWSTRIVAVSLLTGVGWLAVAGAALGSSWLAVRVAALDEVSPAVVAGGAGLSGVWLVVSAWAAWIGQTESATEILRRYRKRLLVAVGPTLFAVGLVVAVCFGGALALIELAPEAGAQALWSGWHVAILLAGAGVALVIAGTILDLNEFSLHGFYRDRLVRCFLGASNNDAAAKNSLWNIRTDDLPLAATVHAVRRDGAPLHLVNTAVNLYNSKDLRVQRRRCDSFVLTPLCCGSRVTNYAPTPERLFLGTAMAVSGAAVSPNMGIYTRDPALSALMTFFNLRLGYWFGNPRDNVCNRWKRPPFAPSYIFAEAFAFTNEDRDFVHLSDGGHYDNLGAYELLRRRCRYIIVVDAECDPEYNCKSLAWLVRIARIDFGIEIKIDIERVVNPKASPPRARVHWLTGEIRYPADPPAHGDGGRVGRLLYIKSSLFAEGENVHIGADVLEYARRNSAFPHEPTADQFFSESQFESYRKLGEAIGAHLLQGVEGGATIEKVFEVLDRSAK